MNKTVGLLLILFVSSLIPLSVSAKTEEEYQKEIQELKQLNVQIENRLVQVTAELKQAMAKIKQLQDQIAKIMSNAEDNAKEVQETRSAMKLVKEQLKNCLEQRSATREKLCKSIEDQLAQSTQRIQALEKELKKAEDTIKKREKQIESLKAKKGTAGIQQEQPELEDVQATSQPRAVSSEESATVEELQQEIILLQTLLKKQKEQLEALRNQAAPLDVQQATQGQQDFEKDAEIVRLAGELRKATDSINQQNEQIADLQARITSLQQEKADLQSRLADESKNLTQQAREAEQLKSEVTLLREQLQKIQAQKQQWDSQTRELAQLKSSLDALQSQLHAVEQQNTQLTEKTTKLEAELVQKNPLAAETLSLRDKVAKLERQLTDMTQQKNAALEKIADLQVELEKRGSVPEEAKNRIQELTLELQEVKVQLDTQQRLQVEYPKLQQEANELRERLNRLKEEQGKVESLQAQLQTMQNMFKETQEKYAKGFKDLEVKEQLLQKTLTEKALLEKQLNEQGSSEATLQAKLHQLEAQNIQLQQQITALKTAQVSKIEAEKDGASLQAALQQLSQERTLREQTESELTAARKKIQAIEQQIAELKKQPASIPPVRQPSATPSYSVRGGSMYALFPREILQGTGGTIKILSWSSDKTKIAYQESTKQVEELWIFNTLTKQKRKITEWQVDVSAGSPIARFAWAFDHEHFLFAIGYPRRYTLYLGHSKGLIGSPVLITDQDVQFAWAPVFLRFAYFNGQTLVIRDVRGETLPVRISETPNTIGTSLQWSPDGTKIAFSLKYETSFDIFILRLVNNTPLLQPLVASPSDDIQPSWSPKGTNIAFYVRSENYDTKIAVTPVDRSRSPYIVAHNVSLPPLGGPVWLSETEILYIGEEYLATSQNSVYGIDITTGRRSSVPMSVVFSNF